jgi:hypothetical protein
MFNLADYLENVLPQVPEVKKIYKTSDLSQIEQLLGDIRNSPDVAIIVRETGDGYLNLRDRQLDSGYHNFFVMVRSTGNSDNRHEAKKKAFQIGLKVLKIMKSQSNDFGDPCYGIDFSKIDYLGIGPIGDNYHGHSFYFLTEQAV